MNESQTMLNERDDSTPLNELSGLNNIHTEKYVQSDLLDQSLRDIDLNCVSGLNSSACR